MQKHNWLRYGFFAMVAASVTGSAMLACSGDDTGGTSGGPKVDSGTDTGPVADTGPAPDTGSDAAPAGKPKVIFVHGANEVGAIRICLVASKTNAAPTAKADAFPTAPLPYKKNGVAVPADAGIADIVAIPPGVGSVLPVNAVDLSTFHIRAVAIKASRLFQLGFPGEQKSCPELLGAATYAPMPADPTKLNENVDFFVLNVIPLGALKQNTTYLAEAVGCPADVIDGNCAPGNKQGALRLMVKELDRTTGGAMNPLQFVHGSPYVDMAFAAAPNQLVKPYLDTAGPDAGDAGVTVIDPTGLDFTGSNAAPKAVPTPGFKATGLTLAVNIGVITPVGSALGQGVGLAATLGGTLAADIPTFVKPGRAYTFIAVGDPAIPLNPAIGDFRGAHFLMFDNDPPVPAL